MLSKLRQTPRLIQAARDNIKDPPGIYVKVGIETMRGALKFIDEDLPRAFAGVDDLHLLGDLADAQAEASQSVASARAAPRNRDGAEGARLLQARPRPVRAEAAARRRDHDPGRSAAGDRDARAAGRRRRPSGRCAGRTNGGDPLAAWAKVEGAASGARRARAASAASSSRSSRRFSSARRSSRCRRARRSPSRRRRTSIAGRSRACGRRARSSRKPSRAYYYLTDVDPSWPPERQDEHLRDYNFPTLWSISIHEVYPGHFLHYQHLRRVESKARKSILFAPASFVEGWAHYCEQMMMEAGFGRQDHAIKLGQLAEALIRLVRFIVCIKLHAEDMSVEQGVRCFREDAFMEEGSARREAERGAFDPTVSRLHRRQADAAEAAAGLKQQQGKAFSLRAFHDTLLGQGTAPFWLHRQLMLGDDSGDVLE